MAPDPQKVQEWLDKQEIREVLVRYCRGIDRLDEELIRSCYHPDSTDDHGGYKGNGQAFAKYVVDVLGKHAESTTHMIEQSLIDVDGDVAHAETYVLANHTARREGALWLETFAGRYIDRLERRAGEWRIADRTVVHDWSRVRPLEETFPNDAFVQGQRGNRQDLVYQRG